MNFATKELINKGWSSDKKYCVTAENGTRYLLRVSDIAQYDTKQSEFNSFLFQLTFGQNSIDAYDAVEKILNIMFPDGNFQYYHNTLQYNSISKAICFCKTQQYDRVLEELKKARYHAEEMTKINHQKTIKFTSPLFSLIEKEHPVTDSDITDIDDFIQCLNNIRCFDPIRETEDFKALMTL